MAATQRQAITAITSLPAPQTAGVYLGSNGNCIELVGHLTAGGAGTVTLLKWIPEANAGAGVWYRYRKPRDVDSTKDDGQFEQMWMIDKGSDYYAVLFSAGLVADELFIQRTEI